MSEPKILIPNNNEIIAIYVEGENEAVQATQTEIGEEQVRAEVMEEPDQSVDKSRKRKREGEEERAGSSNEKSSD